MRHRGWPVHVEHVGDDVDRRRAPLLLLHGFGSGSFTWGPAVTAGLAEGRRAVAFDRFGFGRSARPTADVSDAYSLAGAVELTKAVLDEVGWTEPAVLVGHSAGALVAVATALDAPARVRALVLVAPAVVGGGPPAAVAALFRVPGARRWGPPMLRAGRPFVGRSVAMAWHDRSALTTSGLATAYTEATRQPGWAEGLVELTLATSREDAARVEARLEEIAVPVLVVAGAHDRLVPAEASATVARRVREGRLEVIPACGHVPHEESPAAVVAAVRAFLDALD